MLASIIMLGNKNFVFDILWNFILDFIVFELDHWYQFINDTD